MQGAAVVEYMWHREVAAAHDWITEVLSDLYLNATFVGVHTIDDRLGEWRRDVSLLMHGPYKHEHAQSARHACLFVWLSPTMQCNCGLCMCPALLLTL